jgi:hypothetical protein
MNNKLGLKTLREHIKKVILEELDSASLFGNSPSNNRQGSDKLDPNEFNVKSASSKESNVDNVDLPSDCSANNVGDEFFFKKPDGVVDSMDLINSIPSYDKDKIMNQLNILSLKCKAASLKRKEERAKLKDPRYVAQQSRQPYKVQDEAVIREEDDGGGDSESDSGGDSESMSESLKETHDEFGRRLYKDKHDGIEYSPEEYFEYNEENSNRHDEAEYEQRQSEEDSIVQKMKDHMLHHAIHGTKPEEWDVLDLVDDIFNELTPEEEDLIELSPEILEDLKQKAVNDANSELIGKMQKESKNSLKEKAPPGWKGSTKKMKKHKEIDNPFALAWYMKKKGDEPHYTNSDKPKKKKEFKNESVSPDIADRLSQSLISFLVYNYKSKDIDPSELDAETVLEEFLGTSNAEKFVSFIHRNANENGLSVGFLNLINNAKKHAQNYVSELQNGYRNKMKPQTEEHLGEAKKAKKSLELDLETADPDLLLWLMNNKNNGFKPRIRRIVKSTEDKTEEKK